jgi:CBS domain-containing protein
MTVATILARKGVRVVTIHPDQTLREALAVLAQHSIGALVVVDAAGELVGILSERDIVREAVRNERFFDLTVSAIMTKTVITGQPHDDLDAVARTMTNKRFRHLPVLDAGKLVGVVMKAQRDEYLGEVDTLQTQIIGERAS